MTPATAEVAVVVSRVSKSFRRQQVLTDVTFAAVGGECVAVVGENGSGKSTLLRLCAGLLAPNEGEVRVEGRIGYCPQTPGVLDLLTTEEHLALFGRGVGLARPDALGRGHELLAELGFRAAPDTTAGALSGGARQKLNLALALLGDPEVLLLDEPYQGFDRGSYDSFWEQLQRWREDGRAIVVVTHLLAELSRVDCVVELSAVPARNPWR
jgi:ABC-type multidrug transport system ATPase subunit